MTIRRTSSSSVLRRFGSEGSFGKFLVCLPYAGGSASLFQRWAGILAAQDIGLIAVQPPGRADRMLEPPHLRIAGIVREVADELAELTSGRYLLFGHSMGGLVAFELALWSEARGLNAPEHLFIAAHRAPRRLQSELEWWRMDDKAFLGALRALGGMSDEFLASPELVELMLPVLRADFEALATYEPNTNARVGCPITAIGGIDDDHVPPSELGFWHKHTTSRFLAVPLPGGHFFPWDRAATFPQFIADRISQEETR